MKHERHAVSTAFLINGLRDYKPTAEQLAKITDCTPDALNVVLDAWGNGCHELFDHIAEQSGVIAAVADRCYEALENGFPGMFQYEVTEPVGTDIAHHIANAEDGGTYESVTQAARAALYAHARTFFKQCEDADDMARIDAILVELLPEQVPQEDKRPVVAEAAPLLQVPFQFEIGAQVFYKRDCGVVPCAVITRQGRSQVYQDWRGEHCVSSDEVYGVRLPDGTVAYANGTDLFHTAAAAISAIQQSNSPQ